MDPIQKLLYTQKWRIALGYKDGCSLCTCLMRAHRWSITTEPTPNGKLTKHFIAVKLLYFYCISTILELTTKEYINISLIETNINCINN